MLLIWHISINCQDRFTCHVFNKDDGTGNIQNDTDGLDFLDDYTDNLNHRFSQVDEIRVPSSSPHISDSKIRFELAEVHFWDSTYGYTYSGHNTTWSDNLYTQFVTNKAAVTYKTTSVHIFFPGDTTASRGWASGIGDKDYVLLAGTYNKYLTWLIDDWANAAGLAHELGHSIGLNHTWDSWRDDVDDTPVNNNCWNLNNVESGSGDPITYCDELEEVSNNIMDYNASRASLTLSQIHRAHFYLLGSSGDIEDCLIETITTQTPTVSGGGVVCDDGLEYPTWGRNLKFSKHKYNFY